MFFCIFSRDDYRSCHDGTDIPNITYNNHQGSYDRNRDAAKQYCSDAFGDENYRDNDTDACYNHHTSFPDSSIVDSSSHYINLDNNASDYLPRAYDALGNPLCHSIEDYCLGNGNGNDYGTQNFSMSHDHDELYQRSEQTDLCSPVSRLAFDDRYRDATDYVGYDHSVAEDNHKVNVEDVSHPAGQIEMQGQPFMSSFYDESFYHRSPQYDSLYGHYHDSRLPPLAANVCSEVDDSKCRAMDPRTYAYQGHYKDHDHLDTGIPMANRAVTGTNQESERLCEESNVHHSQLSQQQKDFSERQPINYGQYGQCLFVFFLYGIAVY